MPIPSFVSELAKNDAVSFSEMGKQFRKFGTAIGTMALATRFNLAMHGRVANDNGRSVEIDEPGFENFFRC
jgi:hypothetical protein